MSRVLWYRGVRVAAAVWGAPCYSLLVSVLGVWCYTAVLAAWCVLPSLRLASAPGVVRAALAITTPATGACPTAKTTSATVGRSARAAAAALPAAARSAAVAAAAATATTTYT